MFWGALGGLFYTAGAVCEVANWPVLWPGFGPHEALHLFDLRALRAQLAPGA